MSLPLAQPRFKSTKTDATPLSKPLTFPFSQRTAKNRFLKSSMSEKLATYDAADPSQSGIPTSDLIRLYDRWGQGGWGAILTGNIMISPAHLEATSNTVIPADAPTQGPRFDAFRALAEAARRHGSLVIGQLSHPGRQTPQTLQPNPISASAVQLVAPHMHTTYAEPRAATPGDIRDIIDGFAHAAVFLEQAGFDGVELHAAHGYLLASFLSARTNLRTDAYGGSLENRTRLVLEIVAAIKEKVGKDFVVGVKLNCVEYRDKGMNAGEAAEVAAALEGAGVDFVEASGGTYEDGAPFVKEIERTTEGFFAGAAAQVARSVSKTRVFVVGGLRSLDGMLDVLESGVDGVAIARGAAQEPGLAGDMLAGKVAGSLRYAFGEGNSLKRLVAAGFQLRQIGGGEEPMDLTDGAVVAAWEKMVFGG